MLDFFSNAHIAYKILTNNTLTFAHTKRSNPKLKLIKSYLRLTISQERLSELTILLKKEILAEL